jgi:tRNA U34 5-carboxymethylaminomethyl modifying GTPase MnmE/TrmE
MSNFEKSKTEKPISGKDKKILKKADEEMRRSAEEYKEGLFERIEYIEKMVDFEKDPKKLKELWEESRQLEEELENLKKASSSEDDTEI